MVGAKIEVCANSIESCIQAERGGARRVELCAALSEGGTTPSLGTVQIARQMVNLKMHVIIRPRGGDFCYSDVELRAMVRDIELMRTAGVDGVVFGCLEPDGEIDVERNRVLLEAASGMSTTFHRAFDVCRDQFRATQEIIEMGFDRILTSGGASTAILGAERIGELVARFGDRVVIMPGCGVNEDNIRWLAQKTGAVEFHSSAQKVVDSVMEYRVPSVPMGGAVTQDEFTRRETSSEKVRKMLNELRYV